MFKLQIAHVENDTFVPASNRIDTHTKNLLLHYKLFIYSNVQVTNYPCGKCYNCAPIMTRDQKSFSFITSTSAFTDVALNITTRNVRHSSMFVSSSLKVSAQLWISWNPANCRHLKPAITPSVLPLSHVLVIYKYNHKWNVTIASFAQEKILIFFLHFNWDINHYVLLHKAVPVQIHTPFVGHIFSVI